MQRPRDHDLMVTAARLVGIGHTYVAAGGAVGRDESTIRRWSKLPAFEAERQRAREESIASFPAPRTDRRLEREQGQRQPRLERASSCG
jgi:hypothetical protein